MAKVLIVYHSIGGNTAKMAEAVAEGARSVEGTEVALKTGIEADVDDLLACDGIALGSPDYFSYMAGGLKDFFDRTYYPTHGKVTDKPVGIFVTHGGGGKAVESVKSGCRSFKFRLACASVLVKNQPDDAARKKLIEMGELLGKLAVEG